MKLAGKIAAITGGTAGMGRGIAEAFLAEGAKVALFAGDVMEQAHLEGFIDHTITHFGTLDILVNNAGGAGGPYLRPATITLAPSAAKRRAMGKRGSPRRPFPRSGLWRLSARGWSTPSTASCGCLRAPMTAR